MSIGIDIPQFLKWYRRSFYVYGRIYLMCPLQINVEVTYCFLTITYTLITYKNIVCGYVYVCIDNKIKGDCKSKLICP